MNILKTRRKMRPISAVAGLGLLLLAGGSAQAAVTSAQFAGTGGTVTSFGTLTGIADISAENNLGCTNDCVFRFNVSFVDPTSLGAGTWDILQTGTSTVLAGGALDTLLSTIFNNQFAATFDLAPAPGASAFGATLGGLPLVDISQAFAVGTFGASGVGEVLVSSGNLTAVPLPAAAWLFGSALGMMGVVGGARRRAQRVQSTV